MLDMSAVTAGIGDFVGIGIVGFGLSLFIEWVKEKFSATPRMVRVLTVALAIAIGTAYWFLRDTVLWQNIVGILGVATVVWAFLWKKDQPTQ